MCCDTDSNGLFNGRTKTCLYKTICKEIPVARPTRKHFRCDYKLKSRHSTNERATRANIQPDQNLKLLQSALSLRQSKTKFSCISIIDNFVDSDSDLFVFYAYFLPELASLTKIVKTLSVNLLYFLFVKTIVLGNLNVRKCTDGKTDT